MESLFPDRIAQLRKPGRKLAEVSLLALDSETMGKKRFSLMDILKFSCAFELFKTMFDYARYAGVTDLLITMHPKHEDLYRYLQFETIGRVKPYSSACGHLALPMRMDVAHALKTSRQSGPGAYFLSGTTAASLLKSGHSFSGGEVRELLFENLNLWTQLTPEMQSCFRVAYPEL